MYSVLILFSAFLIEVASAYLSATHLRESVRHMAEILRHFLG